MSEPAIQVRRKGKGTQVWTIEKLENKLVDMRDQYTEWKDGGEDTVRDANKCVWNSQEFFLSNSSFPDSSAAPSNAFL